MWTSPLRAYRVSTGVYIHARRLDACRRTANPCEQSLAEHDVVRKPPQVQGVHDDVVLPEHVAQIRPMALLRILLRETVGRLVGADDHARRLLDVFDGRHSPHVRVLFSPGVTVARLEDNERRPAPAAVIQKQHAPTIQEHGLMPGRKARLTSIANPLGEIDEGHQARDCTHMVIFYLIQGRAGRSAVFELATAPLTWRAYSPACVTRIGPKRASRAANKASNGKPFVYDELVGRNFKFRR
jgi:hypothetical protein